jgi:hypothetical protein
MSKLDEQLQCEAYRLDYNCKTKIGHLYMAEGDCCDMVGCIQRFRKIDSEVREIRTYAGAVKDTFYQRNDEGDWRAVTREGVAYDWCEIPWKRDWKRGKR